MEKKVQFRNTRVGIKKTFFVLYMFKIRFKQQQKKTNLCLKHSKKVTFLDCLVNFLMKIDWVSTNYNQINEAVSYLSH